MKNLLIKLIKIYQAIPFQSHGYCKFQPRCSDYGIEALNEYGAFRGSAMTVWRILRCNPFNKGGYDPVKRRKKK